ncbi:phosphoenolpyruvate hydrolase family protein [Rathayibacter oskolensis]|nr:phosphoenolpyruvate hydrolase family protein [Rathayibacter oskolensis]WKK72600.1 phosphoenolpyruvate hydrolase family protein [Rathayibacter oskolensis]
MTEAGADVVVVHLGLTTGGSIGAETARTLDDGVALASAWAAAARSVRDDVIVLVHGGPVAEPEDAQYVLSNAVGIDGFYGASSMERLPTERALTAQVRRFTSLSLPTGAAALHGASPSA